MCKIQQVIKGHVRKHEWVYIELFNSYKQTYIIFKCLLSYIRFILTYI